MNYSLHNSVNRRNFLIYIIILMSLSWGTYNLFSSRTGMSGRTGQETNGCGGPGCHGNLIPSPETIILVESGSGYYSVKPGTTSNYTVTIRNNSCVNAGINIAVVDFTGSIAGQLGNIQSDLKLMDGELVHSVPKALENTYATFQFVWTAPMEQGTYQIMVAVCCSNNDNQANTADQWAWMLPVEIVVDAGPPIISVSPASIDFGDVRLGRSKDSTLLVRNTGKNPLRISGIELLGDNASEFSLPNATLFELEPDSAKVLRVRFIPHDMSGRKYASINLTNNTIVSPKIVNITGNCSSAPQGKIILSRTSFDFGPCKINEYAERTLTVFNKGDYDLEVNSANISGKQSGEFSFASPTTFTLAPDSSYQIIIRFNPKTTGDKYAEINFTSNSSTDPVVSLIGLGLPGPKPTLLLSSTDLDFGNVAVTKSKDTSIIMKNIGELPLDVTGCKVTGGHSLEFSIVSGGGSFYLMTNEERVLKLRYTPKISGTDKMAAVEFTCNDDAKPKLNMTAAAYDLPKPVLTLGVKEVDFGFVPERTEKDTFVLVTNTGNELMYLEQPVFRQNTDSNEFELKSSMFPRSLFAGESLKVNFRLKPVKAGNKGAIVDFTSNGGSGTVTFLSTAIINSVGESSIAEFSISPNPATDYIEISYSPLAKGARGLLVDLKIYNVFGEELLLSPAGGGEGDGASSQYSTKIDVSGLPPGVYFVKVEERVGRFVKL